MATFKDKTGDEWLIDLSVGDVARIKRDTGVNLNDAFVPDDAGKTVLMRLASSIEQTIAVLYAACEPQVAERGLSPEDFARRFTLDTVEDATAALGEAICNFFPKRLRDPMHRARRKVHERIAANQPTEKELDAMIDATIDRLLPRRATSIEPLTASPA